MYKCIKCVAYIFILYTRVSLHVNSCNTKSLTKFINTLEKYRIKSREITNHGMKNTFREKCVRCKVTVVANGFLNISK